MMLPNATNTVVIDAQHPLQLKAGLVEAGIILVKDSPVELPDGTLLLANHIEMNGGGFLKGHQFSIASTVIEGGSIIASGKDGLPGRREGRGLYPPIAGSPGGDILVAVASIPDTPIRADGGAGGSGLDGADGSDQPRAASGQDGRCAGFGGYGGAQPGINGAAGKSGNPGQDGAAGGAGGQILLLIPNNYPVPALTADKGTGGHFGRGGHGGRGQQGGQGGSGCVGLGGSQTGAHDGLTGRDGLSGKDGNRGEDGKDGTKIVRHVPFRKIERAWVNSGRDPSKFLAALRAFPGS